MVNHGDSKRAAFGQLDLGQVAFERVGQDAMRPGSDPDALQLGRQLGRERVRGLREQEDQVRCALGRGHEREASKD